MEVDTEQAKTVRDTLKGPRKTCAYGGLEITFFPVVRNHRRLLLIGPHCEDLVDKNIGGKMYMDSQGQHDDERASL